MRLHELTACAMRDGLERGAFTSVELIEALHRRADATEPAINGFTVQLRAQALEDAARADRERRQQRVRGPLHGIPLTIKDNIDVAGAPSTLGLTDRRGHRARQDAVIVRLARAAGAIVLGKSNVPQALVPMDCENRVFGRTRNPWRATHVTGGSSGGEAALIACGASALGIGSDLGGSIRFPAAFCGVAGLKPTTDRWSNRGLCSPLRGQEFVRAQIGPMARSSADLALLLSALPSPAHARHDPRVAPLPLGDPAAVDLGTAVVGWYDDDGFMPPAPAMRRALHLARDALAARGARLVELPPPDQREVVATYLGATSSDGMRSLRRAFAGEAPVAGLRTIWRAGRVPRAVRRTTGQLLRWLGEDRLGAIIQATGARDAAALWQLAARRQALRAAEIDRWNRADIDLLLTPAAASPAVPIGMEHDFAIIFSYFGRYNLFDLPAGVVPTTRVRASETAGLGHGGDRFARRARQVAARSEGLPVAVQLVARPWREDVLLAGMLAVEEHARGQADYPATPVEPATDG